MLNLGWPKHHQSFAAPCPCVLGIDSIFGCLAFFGCKRCLFVSRRNDDTGYAVILQQLPCEGGGFAIGPNLTQQTLEGRLTKPEVIKVNPFPEVDDCQTFCEVYTFLNLIIAKLVKGWDVLNAAGHCVVIVSNEFL